MSKSETKRNANHGGEKWQKQRRVEYVLEYTLAKSV